MKRVGMPEHRISHRGRVLACLLLLGCVLASVLEAQSVTPGRQKVLREHFLKGKALVENKRYLPALRIFEAILKEDPQARGSLLMSGLACNQLLLFNKASAFFDRFLALEPNHVSGNLGALKAYQSSGMREKALAVRDRLLELQRQGKDPRFKILLSYEREVRQMPSGQVLSIQEAYPGKEVFTWKLLLLKRDMSSIDRALEWKSATAADKQVLEVDEARQLWLLGEPVYEAGRLKDYKIRKMHEGALDYEHAVSLAVDILQ